MRHLRQLPHEAKATLALFAIAATAMWGFLCGAL